MLKGHGRMAAVVAMKMALLIFDCIHIRGYDNLEGHFEQRRLSSRFGSSLIRIRFIPKTR